MARRKIAQRVVRLEAGLFGDVKFFDGIGELRVDFGPGYRIYFVQRGRVLIILLCGGDKSTQGATSSGPWNWPRRCEHGPQDNSVRRGGVS